MSPELHPINTEIERVLDALAQKQGNEIVDKIRPIIYFNLKRERLQVYIDGGVRRVKAYVMLVADIYKLSVWSFFDGLLEMR